MVLLLSLLVSIFLIVLGAAFVQGRPFDKSSPHHRFAAPGQLGQLVGIRGLYFRTQLVVTLHLIFVWFTTVACRVPEFAVTPAAKLFWSKFEKSALNIISYHHVLNYTVIIVILHTVILRVGFPWISCIVVTPAWINLSDCIHSSRSRGASRENVQDFFSGR